MHEKKLTDESCCHANKSLLITSTSPSIVEQKLRSSSDMHYQELYTLENARNVILEMRVKELESQLDRKKLGGRADAKCLCTLF